MGTQSRSGENNDLAPQSTRLIQLVAGSVEKGYCVSDALFYQKRFQVCGIYRFLSEW